MVDTYNKLVRDRIAELIRQQGDHPEVEILDDSNYIKALNAKLYEEVDEYHVNYDVGELADILEVVRTIAIYNGLSPDELEQLRQKKYNERGGFNDKIFLTEVRRNATI